VLLVCRFADPAPDFAARAGRALELLTAQPGCFGGELGRSVDEPGAWVLAVRFATVDAYRRALGPFDVRAEVVPLLSEAMPEASTYETLGRAADGELATFPSLRA